MHITNILLIFLSNLKHQRRKGISSIKNKETTNKVLMSENETGGAKTVDKKAICNAFKKSFAEIGKYSSDFVPLNIHKVDHCSETFNFRVLTLKEIYKTIDSLENSKSPGS